MNIPTVNDLTWEDHPAGMGGYRSIVEFPNGYGASVLEGGPFYTKDGTFEIAVLDENGNITYDTPITSDVLGHLSDEEANQALIDIASLPKKQLLLN